MNNKGIIYIDAYRLCPHPDNPRKDLGDLTELTESIRKNGIMQNLTVIPKEDDPESYMILIGHRRYAAGKAAGVTEFPCRVTAGLSQREQLSIMLEENMQRSDLTIIEQAQGFQMMLDLGETEESISEKTGFSRSTVRHRLNIAKLNPNLIKEKQQDEGFQLSLTDLYKLEKLNDVKDRERILEKADSSEELAAMVEDELERQEYDAKADFLITELKAFGVEPFPEDKEYQSWSSKWETIVEYRLYEKIPEEIEIDTEDDGRKLYYVRTGYRGNWLRVIKKAKQVKKGDSPFEKRQKEKKELIKDLETVLDNMARRRKGLIDRIISGEIAPVKDELGHMKEMWKNIVALNCNVAGSSIGQYFIDKENYMITLKDLESVKDQVDALTEAQQMLIIIHSALHYHEGCTSSMYGTPYNKEAAQKVVDACMVYLPYGWYFEDEEKKVLNGTHEYYERITEINGAKD